MGVFTSKPEKVDETPNSKVVKRIEDPRSPTEEISRTPIEVADNVRSLRESNNCSNEFSPMLRKTEVPLSRKLLSNFDNKLEEARGKENNQRDLLL